MTVREGEVKTNTKKKMVKKRKVVKRTLDDIPNDVWVGYIWKYADLMSVVNCRLISKSYNQLVMSAYNVKCLFDRFNVVWNKNTKDSVFKLLGLLESCVNHVVMYGRVQTHCWIGNKTIRFGMDGAAQTQYIQLNRPYYTGQKKLDVYKGLFVKYKKWFPMGSVIVHTRWETTSEVSTLKKIYIDTEFHYNYTVLSWKRISAYETIGKTPSMGRLVVII